MTEQKYKELLDNCIEKDFSYTSYVAYVESRMIMQNKFKKILRKRYERNYKDQINYLKQEIDTRVNYKDVRYIAVQLYNEKIVLSYPYLLVQVKKTCEYKKIKGRIYLEQKEADDFIKNIVEYKTKHK